MTMTISLLPAKPINFRRSRVKSLAACLVLAGAVGACSPQASAPELVARAQAAMAQGDARAAEIDAKTALQQSPDNAEARRLVGESYLFQQNPVAAVDEFERALSLAEDDEVRVLYARALVAADRADRLLELDAQGSFTNVSGNPDYLIALARAKAVSGDLTQARELLDRALALAPDDPDVTTAQALFLMVYSGEPEEARISLENTLAAHPEHADAWSILGGVQQLEGELEAAEASYERVVELNPYRFTDSLSLATVRLDQGKTEEAEEQLQRMLANNPNHPGVNFLHGRMLVEAGDRVEALTAFQKVLSVIPDHPGSLYLAAIANIGEGNLATALGQLDTLLALQPDNFNGHLLLSNLHLLMNDPEEAELVARGLLQYDDSNYAAMTLLATALENQGENGPELVDLRERMAASQPDAVEPRLALAAAQLRAGDSVNGISQLEAARDLDPESVEVWGRLIQAHLALGDIATARTEAEAYARQQPDNSRPLIYLARIAQQQNDSAQARIHFGEAEALLRTALDGQPDSLEYSSLLLNVLMGQGKLEEADVVLAGLPEEAANQPAVLVARGRIALAGDRPADAEALLRSALNNTPDSMTLLWLSGAIDAQGREEEALKVLNDWLLDNPTDAMVRNELAASYLQMGNESEARNHYQEVVKSAPDNVIVLNNLAWLLRAEDPDQALVYIEKANALAPGNPLIMDTYAMIQAERGASGEALSLNQQALAQIPDNPDFLFHRAMILQADGQREEAIRILQGLVDASDVAQGGEAQALLAELQQQ